METTKVKKETKNKIRVDFERAPLSVRLKQKFLSMDFLVNVVFKIFRFILLVGVSYVILYPYIAKIFASFMSISDFKDVTVILISKSPTLEQYKYIITDNGYFLALLNTFLLSLSVALIQTVVCALVAYGLAKFKFKGNNIIFFLVIFTMMVPQEALMYAMDTFFATFSKHNVIGMLLSSMGAIGEYGFENTMAPLYILSFLGLGFKNGLFIFMLRQFFKGVPDELEESAYVDGSSTMRTFFTIIIPLAIPMLVTVFIFSFAWTWTDDFYSTIFFDSTYEGAMKYMSDIAVVPESLEKYTNSGTSYANVYSSAITGTASILIILPLLIAYIFVQNKIVQGIERSGIVG
ncbi:MAG: carbohydrate ABC transporter permease [Clostridia bacterium]|nr:carbohydrate ABC transporter permease [Clostridia bacterium]MBQ7788891.1 carbohydrate ABC transporter permease [Clostridia bacterium]